MIERPPTLMTWHSGSMRTTGVSVEDITSLSSRLSRMRSERTWWRRSSRGLSIMCLFSPRHSGGDDRADGFAIERTGQVARYQPIDHLYRAPMLGVFHHLEDASLDDDVIQVQGVQLLNRDCGDEFRRAVLLGIGGIEPILVLNVDHRAGTKDLAHQIDAGVGPIRRDASDGRVRLPVDVGRHAEEDHRP